MRAPADVSGRARGCAFSGPSPAQPTGGPPKQTQAGPGSAGTERRAAEPRPRPHPAPPDATERSTIFRIRSGGSPSSHARATKRSSRPFANRVSTGRGPIGRDGMLWTYSVEVEVGRRLRAFERRLGGVGRRFGGVWEAFGGFEVWEAFGGVWKVFGGGGGWNSPGSGGRLLVRPGRGCGKVLWGLP